MLCYIILYGINILCMSYYIMLEGDAPRPRLRRRTGAVKYIISPPPLIVNPPNLNKRNWGGNILFAINLDGGTITPLINDDAGTRTLVRIMY